MASLVEFQEFKHSVFADTCDLQAFEDLLGGMELPTPPLSPDHAEGTDSTQLSTHPEDIDIGETILQQMMASEDVLFDSQGTYGSDSSDGIDIESSLLNPQALLQDCMWNCDAYEPRHSISSNGIYTPAPSPPPAVKSIIEEEDEDHMPTFEPVSEESKEAHEDFEEEEERNTTTGKVGADTATDSSGSKDKVIESSVKMEKDRKLSFCYKRSLSSSCNGTSRVQPQAAATSESGKFFSLVCKF